MHAYLIDCEEILGVIESTHKDTLERNRNSHVVSVVDRRIL